MLVERETECPIPLEETLCADVPLNESDERSCAGFRSAPIGPCDASLASGGQGITTNFHTLGTTQGMVRVRFNMFTIPDALEVRFNYVLVATTGGPTSGENFLLWFYSPITDGPNFCKVTIIGPGAGTVWEYTLECPTLDYTEFFNTDLGETLEAVFQAWMITESAGAGRDISADLYDYDLRGFFHAGGTFAGGGHAPDTWKKPNHHTFSNESIYSGGFSDEVGGVWGNNGTQDTFTAGFSNLRCYSVADLQAYFAAIEPDVLLIIP